MKINCIAIDDELEDAPAAFADYLIIALNKALEKANNINEAEMAAAAKDGLPDIPGMDIFK